MRASTFAAALCSATVVFGASAQAQFSTPSQKKPQPAKPVVVQGRGTSHQGFLVGGSDNCATADVIAGPGTFSVNSVGATGSSSVPCGSCQADVWFSWTATSTGATTISFCGGIGGADSLIAVYTGSCGSPTEIACNDDFCGLESQLTFSAVAGNSYLLEMGGFAGTTYVGTFTISVGAPPTGDDCSSPIAISGTGTFPFDNSAATTGSQGQNEPLCNAFGTTGITNDIWFDWTASGTGTATLSVCGGATLDTKVAAYSGAGCPAGAALACNDDTCNVQSRISFPCTGGAHYAIQFGNFPGAGAGSGTFTMSIASPDACATPMAISGTGTFPFDNTAATTGAQGQSEPLCNFFGTPGINNDIWYDWTCTTTGNATISFCGGTSMDSKVAVYSGAGCPSAAAIACNDDSCNFQSQLTFACSIGTHYAIQVGNYPGASPSSGTFTIAIAATTGGCDVYDDGISDNTLGLTGGGDIVWLHREGAIGLTITVSSISTAYGSAAFPGSSPPAGTPSTIAIWDDPNDDGNPNDLVLLATVSTTVQNPDTDILNVTNLNPPVVVTGTYFIGVLVTHAAGQFPAGLDQSTSSFGRAWVAGDAAGTMNLANINAATIPPTEMDSIGFPGVWLLRASCSFASPDNCANAVPMPPFSMGMSTISGSNIGATIESNPVYCAPSGADVWYSFNTGAIGGVYTVDTCTGPAMDTVLSLHTSCPSGTISNAIACNDDSCGLNSSFTVSLSAGTTYLVRVAGFASTTGSFTLQVTQPATFTYLCFGDGSGTQCPCGNNSPPGTNEGCLNSLGVGAVITASGTPSISMDTLLLQGSNMPNSSALYFQGTAVAAGGAGIVFGDGLRCASGTVVRLGTKTNVGGMSQYPAPGDNPVALQGGVMMPGFRYYQIWYRNPSPFCTTDTYNLSETVCVPYMP